MGSSQFLCWATSQRRAVMSMRRQMSMSTFMAFSWILLSRSDRSWRRGARAEKLYGACRTSRTNRVAQDSHCWRALWREPARSSAASPAVPARPGTLRSPAGPTETTEGTLINITMTQRLECIGNPLQLDGWMTVYLLQFGHLVLQVHPGSVFFLPSASTTY